MTICILNSLVGHGKYRQLFRGSVRIQSRFMISSNLGGIIPPTSSFLWVAGPPKAFTGQYPKTCSWEKNIPTTINSININMDFDHQKYESRSYSSSSRRNTVNEKHEEIVKIPQKSDPDDFPEFKDIADLHPSTIKAITDVLGLQKMTEIQHKTFHAAVTGKDVLGRARTGTGKTLAFLLPSLERILRQRADPSHHHSTNSIEILVISPTRELAIQIGQQARSLLSLHNPMYESKINPTAVVSGIKQTDSQNALSCHVMFGGSSRQNDVRMLERKLPTILVATPGRLQDHLSNTSVNGTKLSDIVKQSVQVLVLDETDRLLDMGFRQEIEQIISYLPNENRQTLLFSATMPKQLRQIMANSMRPNYLTVDCIHDQDPATHTNAQVIQSHIILPTAQRLVSGPVEILLRIMNREPNHKIIVFFPTAHLVTFYANLFNNLGYEVTELHSRKSQDYRTKMSHLFRKTKKGILFTTDVSARGVDYPDVTHVIQIGMSDSRETYIHRLGRTGRAGKKGQGLLILSEEEKNFLEKLEGLNIPRNEKLQNFIMADKPPSTRVMSKLNPVLQSVRSGTNKRLKQNAEQAYRSMLGFYCSKLVQIGVTCKKTLVHKLNSFATQSGLAAPPTIQRHTLRNMGLADISGLRTNLDGQQTQKGRYDAQRIKDMKPSPYKKVGKLNNHNKNKYTNENIQSSNILRTDMDVGLSSSDIRRALKKKPRRGKTNNRTTTNKL